MKKIINKIIFNLMCRQLQRRISEHKNHIRRNTSTHSVIMEHMLHFGHDFDWKNIEILDVERNFSYIIIR